jgi:peptidoglycan/LPS O-acetylase OafA/YrhL
VLSHLWITQFGMLAHTGALGFWMNWIIYSHFAVDVFIVLSGYCLILPVARAGELRGGAFDFVRRRARRILPPCYAALTLATAIYTLTHLHKPFPWIALLGNIFLVQDAVQRWNVFDSPLWSVAVEWRIYFLFPAIAWLLRRHGRIAVLAATAAVAYALTAAVFTWRLDLFMSSPWYLFLFAMGVCAGWTAVQPHLELRRWALASWGFALVALVLVWRNPMTNTEGADFGRHLPLIDTALGAAVALALISLHRHPHGRVRMLLSTAPLVRLGGMSYSLYLIHLPILQSLSILLRALHLPWAHSPFIRLAILAVVGLPIVWAATVWFYHTVERRFLTVKRTP